MPASTHNLVNKMSAASARTRNSNKTRRHEGVPCPFCPLLCDDLVIEQSGQDLKVVEHACPQARAGFERPLKALKPRVGGETATLEQAVSAAAELLRAAAQPLFAGLGTDVSGMRATLALAERTRGIVDHMHGDALNNNYRVLQTRGWMTTTLTEVRNRADLILFAGTDARNHSRFYDRAVWPDKTLFEPKPAQRQLIYLGRGLKTGGGHVGKRRKAEHIQCPPELLGEAAGAINAVLHGQPLKYAVAGIKPKAIEALAEKLRNARYSVIVWSPGDLPTENGEAIIESLCNLVQTLNETTRSGGFILGGADGATTAANVTAWLTGYPLRVSFARGYPHYDPAAYRTRSLLDDAAVDALFWLSTLNATIKAPVSDDLPSVVVADSDRSFSQEPDVFIPVGTPGVDQAGTLIRTDSVVSLPLKQLRDSQRPSAATVVQAILSEL